MKNADLDPKASWVLLAVLHGNPNNPNYEISGKEAMKLIEKAVSIPTFIRAKNHLLARRFITEQKRGYDKYYGLRNESVWEFFKKSEYNELNKLMHHPFYREVWFNPELYDEKMKFPSIMAMNAFVSSVMMAYLKGEKEEEWDSAAYLAKFPPSVAHQQEIFLEASKNKDKMMTEAEHRELNELIKKLGSSFLEAHAKFQGL